jgi:hypothetical protein
VRLLAFLSAIQLSSELRLLHPLPAATLDFLATTARLHPLQLNRFKIIEELTTEELRVQICFGHFL